MLNKRALEGLYHLIYTVSAPAGTGKTTLVTEVMKINPKVKQAITCTTRRPRGQEVNGQDYLFISTNEFENLIENDRLLEYVKLYDCYYGTPVNPIVQIVKEGCYPVLVIDVQGAMALKKLYPSITTIFIEPPSVKILEERLRGRKTESEEAIQKRLKIVNRELSVKNAFDHIIVNDDLKSAVDDLNQIFTKI